MEEVKRKRGRPRKNVVQLPDEIQKLVDEVKAKEQEEFHQIIVEQKEKHRHEWDVKIGDPINFFDSTLSYEITGYKPIDGKHGLDFNPKWFTEAADTKKRTGHYCQFPRNSKAYCDFWDEQYRRCRDGMTVNGYTITGDNYFFLNFYQLLDITDVEEAGSGRQFAFPSFFVKQYEYFHYIKLCKILRKNAIGIKARGVGFSEIGASISVNTYNSRRNTVTVLAAQQDIYLEKTLDKCWTQLDYLNLETDGGFTKLRQVNDSQLLKKASVYVVKDGQRNEDGWLSQIQGIKADKPNKIRGDRTDLLIYEESGSWPNWKKAFMQGDALVGIQGRRFGIKMAWGTGGDSGPALEGLSDAYNNPDVYDALPYRHHYTPDGAETISAYFIPAYSIINVPGYIDDRGWTDPEKGKAFYEAERDKRVADPQALIIYCAEYCFTADEAFSLEGENKFNKVLIADQIAKIRVHGIAPTIEHGNLDFINTEYAKKNLSKMNHEQMRWIKNDMGKIHILEHPIWTFDRKDEDGNPIPRPKEMRGMYIAGIDGIDIGANQTSEFTKDPSDFCIVIKKRVRGLEEPQYVAYYKDRPNDIREAYKNAMKLLFYYNCQCNIEATRMSMVLWARDRGLGNFFMKRPRGTLQDPMRGKTNTVGTPATASIIAHQTDLIAAFVEDYCHNIWFPEMLDQLNRYSDENKGKFDIIAAMGMAELADEELQGYIPNEVEVEKEVTTDIGFYYDEYGRKRYGIIPAKINQTIKHKDEVESIDYSWTGSSDPRRR